jgi:hypothetical protein
MYLKLQVLENEQDAQEKFGPIGLVTVSSKNT